MHCEDRKNGLKLVWWTWRIAAVIISKNLIGFFISYINKYLLSYPQFSIDFFFFFCQNCKHISSSAKILRSRIPAKEIPRHS
jgi:hypothetical protein